MSVVPPVTFQGLGTVPWREHSGWALSQVLRVRRLAWRRRTGPGSGASLEIRCGDGGLIAVPSSGGPCGVPSGDVLVVGLGGRRWPELLPLTAGGGVVGTWRLLHEFAQPGRRRHVRSNTCAFDPQGGEGVVEVALGDELLLRLDEFVNRHDLSRITMFLPRTRQLTCRARRSVTLVSISSRGRSGRVMAE